MLQTHRDEAKVKHKQEIADKQKAHASAIAKKNATIQETKKEKQDYIHMHYKLVDVVDGAHQCAEDTIHRRGVSQMLWIPRDKQPSPRTSTSLSHTICLPLNLLRPFHKPCEIASTVG